MDASPPHQAASPRRRGSRGRGSEGGIIRDRVARISVKFDSRIRSIEYPKEYMYNPTWNRGGNLEETVYFVVSLVAQIFGGVEHVLDLFNCGGPGPGPGCIVHPTNCHKKNAKSMIGSAGHYSEHAHPL
ncbi:hypothetical protein C8R45DRAFT_931476 [Mycena sanguinolenta]|nr:hypothetical protein C8R45DRAFT_931476 [Mycena sanguinolenta]